MSGERAPEASRIVIGASREEQLEVIDELTVGHSVAGMPMVFATPQMIHAMEVVCAALIAPSLPAGWVSVGTRVEVEHLAATPVGMCVRTSATVIDVAGRVVTFEVTAEDGIELIGRGRHARALVELARFNAGTRSKRNAAS